MTAARWQIKTTWYILYCKKYLHVCCTASRFELSLGENTRQYTYHTYTSPHYHNNNLTQQQITTFYTFSRYNHKAVVFNLFLQMLYLRYKCIMYLVFWKLSSSPWAHTYLMHAQSSALLNPLLQPSIYYTISTFA